MTKRHLCLYAKEQMTVYADVVLGLPEPMRLRIKNATDDVKWIDLYRDEDDEPCIDAPEGVEYRIL